MSSNTLLPEGHVLEAFLADHRRIRALLGELLETLESGPTPEEAERLSQELEELARHEALEEDVLFPLLRSKGVKNEPNLFVAEHGLLRSLRADLGTRLSRWAPARRSPHEIVERARVFTRHYLDHLEHEEATVYVAAAKLLDDRELWLQVKRGRAASEDICRRT